MDRRARQRDELEVIEDLSEVSTDRSDERKNGIIADLNSLVVANEANARKHLHWERLFKAKRVAIGTQRTDFRAHIVIANTNNGNLRDFDNSDLFLEWQKSLLILESLHDLLNSFHRLHPSRSPFEFAFSQKREVYTRNQFKNKT